MSNTEITIQDYNKELKTQNALQKQFIEIVRVESERLLEETVELRNKISALEDKIDDLEFQNNELHYQLSK